MKISLITASYNSAATIRDTLQSVATQTWPHIEHIIIDGYSLDDTLGIVSQFPHITHIISEKDKGIYDAMNKGIALATGDIIGIINSDDFYTGNNVISAVLREFEDETVDVVYGDIQYVKATNTDKVVRTWRSGNFDPKKFYYGWMPPHPALFVRKQLYEQFGTFNISLRTSADYEFMLRILLRNNRQAKYIPEILVKMRTGGASNASLAHRLKANREDRKAWQLNGIKPWFFTIPLTPLRKIFQYFIK